MVRECTRCGWDKAERSNLGDILVRPTQRRLQRSSPCSQKAGCSEEEWAWCENSDVNACIELLSQDVPQTGGLDAGRAVALQCPARSVAARCANGGRPRLQPVSAPTTWWRLRLPGTRAAALR